jgi:type IV secretory pathway TraG/TraD family ATPase VirD4
VSTVLDRLTPATGVPVFDPTAFVTSTDTLVIVSDSNSAVNCAPLATMLVWQLVDAAKTAALSTPTGRLTVPLRLVLDEVANIAPLPELPDIATDIRAYGIQTVYVLQSHAQVEEKWGRVRARMLIDNAPAVLVLGGLKDDDALERFSRLAGQVEVHEITTSYDHSPARRSVSQSTRERRVLRAEEIRMLQPGTGLLLFSAMPAALVRLTDWTDRPDAQQLEEGRRDTIAYRLEEAG